MFLSILIHSSAPTMMRLNLSLLLLFFIGCSPSASDAISENGSVPETYTRVDGELADKMGLAISKAKGELEGFIRRLNDPKPSDTYFSVKKPFEFQVDGETHFEHIWINDLSFADGKFRGSIANDPVDVQGLKFGDQVEFEKNEVSDWMIISDNVLNGGYTILALRDSMSEAERKAFDNGFPFQISSEKTSD